LAFGHRHGPRRGTGRHDRLCNPDPLNAGAQGLRFFPWSRFRLRSPQTESDLPIQEIIETVPGVNLGMARDAIENPEMRSRAATLWGLIDSPALQAGKNYGGLDVAHVGEYRSLANVNVGSSGPTGEAMAFFFAP